MSTFITGKLNKRNIILLLLVIGLLFVGGYFAAPLLFDAKTVAEVTPAPVEPEKPVSIEIVCVGDIMVHEPQIPSQYDAETGEYDYTNNFQYVKKYIEKADLALGNFEGTFGGLPYAGYPAFSTPDQLATALKQTGFDVAITANNHMVDRGHQGVLRTLKILRDAGLQTSGSMLAGNESRYSISRVKGADVAVVAYTYETSGSGPGVSINGSAVSDETAGLINSFSYNRLETDLAKMKDNVTAAKQAGADIVILYLHWGEEYQQISNQWQEQMVASAVEEMNVDIIFASHPHVLQKMELFHSEVTGRDVPVFYSMGNFISNQREETLQNRYTEQGMIARVELEFMAGTGEILNIKMNATPTWVDRYRRDGKTVYEIIPLDTEMEQNPALIESGHLTRAKEALEDINGILKLN